MRFRGFAESELCSFDEAPHARTKKSLSVRRFFSSDRIHIGLVLAACSNARFLNELREKDGQVLAVSLARCRPSACNSRLTLRLVPGVEVEPTMR